MKNIYKNPVAVLYLIAKHLKAFLLESGWRQVLIKRVLSHWCLLRSLPKTALLDLPAQSIVPILGPGENFWFTEKFFHFN